MTSDNPDIDTRSSLFIGLTVENLARLSATWPRPAGAPIAVQDLMAQSRRLFVGAASSYDNFVQAVLVSLQASEEALRELVGSSVSSKATLGNLVHSSAADAVLTERQRQWYQDFALPFRNSLSHPKEPTAFTPGMSEQIVHGVHVLITELFPQHESAHDLSAANDE